MYDHLDDATPPDPSPGARTRVSTRATQLRRRRRRALAAGGFLTGLVAAVVVVLLSVSGGSPSRATLTTATTPTATPAATATTEGTASPTPSTGATSLPTPAPVPTDVTAPRACPNGCRVGPSPAPSAGCPSNDRGYQDCKDGTPGWSTGFTSCRPFEHGNLPSRPDIGVTPELRVPDHGQAGSVLRGTLVLTNDNAGTVRFTVPIASDTDLEVGLQNAGASSAAHGTDVVGDEHLELAPGESATLPVHVATTACGDTSRDGEPPLPSGTYTAWLRVVVQDATLQPSADPAATPQPRDSGGAWDLSAQVTLG